MLLVDEAARVPDDVFDSLTPMLASTQGDLWLMSTPLGRRGFFYRMWHDTEDDWVRVSVPASACARIPEWFFKRELKWKGERKFREEYCCEFLSTEDQLLRDEVIEAAFDCDEGPLFQ